MSIRRYCFAQTDDQSTKKESGNDVLNVLLVSFGDLLEKALCNAYPQQLFSCCFGGKRVSHLLDDWDFMQPDPLWCFVLRKCGRSCLIFLCLRAGRSSGGGDADTLRGLDELDGSSGRAHCYDLTASTSSLTATAVGEWSADQVRRWLLEGAGLERPVATAEALAGITGSEFVKMDNGQLKVKFAHLFESHELHSTDGFAPQAALRAISHQFCCSLYPA